MSRVRAPFKPPRPISADGSTSGATQVVPKPSNFVLTRPSTNNSITTSPQVTATHPDPKRQKLITYTRFEAQWRRKTAKKNKTWDGDGIVEFDGSTAILKIEKPDGKLAIVGRSPRKTLEGLISFGKYEAEVDEILNVNSLPVVTPIGNKTSSTKINSINCIEDKTPHANMIAHKLTSQYVPPKPLKTLSPALKPALTSPMSTRESSPIQKKPADQNEGLVLSSQPLPVVVDPALSDVLRPHQQEGVKFLYEATMGMRNKNANNGNSQTFGALLADEMGLGKTLMTISLIFTLLKQNPESKTSPVCAKVLIVCPVTLIGNWRKEFKKWLGERVSVLTLNPKQTGIKDKQDIRNFGKNKVYQVIILNYEKVIAAREELKSVQFDLLVCDEAHRLKNTTSKVVKTLNELNIQRRVLLTGTPIQNDLTEFYNIIDFVNPGVLGTLQSFQKEFLRPISRAREVNCVDQEIIKFGEQKSSELMQMTQYFTLRRTSAILKKYLTPKTDIILFCPPTKQQSQLFRYVLLTNKFSHLSENLNDSLAMILLFKKICNSPLLLASDRIFQSLNYLGLPLEKNSSKINVLIPLLIEIRGLGEKTVIISNYTQVLELLEDVLQKLNITFLRLDGQTPKKDRDRLVRQFNSTPPSENSVFLLSAKSGGVGLNLIGASRLVLFDNDWNPSVDIQAMARIHRDGQKRPVFVYRLFTTGCIDEKIFQRQLMKISLSDKFIDNKADSSNDVFGTEDLKDLFTVVDDTTSNTHDLLDCQCSGRGEKVEIPEEDELRSEMDSQEADLNLLSSQANGWMTALDYNKLSQSETKKAATFRYALLEYCHYNPQASNQDLGDLVLNLIIRNSPNCISYSLLKKTEDKLD